ncbi:unnamed protein product [Rotaria sordida]|uniref:F-box domain-containing protein n=1 Tax=Rotaria sordida TaxID=392033 RepID=A0A814CQ62_9BILA|nr:unnamed protein product [Rotaria sordida]CAF0946462.1 unnamed protein product [Rotaria sordida]CAF0982396.1 unnamed protein product [Rotaria sordida]CAF4109346.1 unnamed protein product [Rotaria sordida]
MSITSIENLSNELFYEIFDYFNGCEIYQTFSNLNYCFQQLLNSSSFRFKINFHHSTSIEIFMNNYKQIILLNKDQIFSIHLTSSTHNNQIISLLNIDSSFIHLESLFFSSIELNILTLLLPKLTQLPRFFSLTIDTRQTLKDLSDVYRLIFNLPKLKYIKFSAVEPENIDVTVSLPITTNKQVSTIKYLVIDHPCAFNELFTIISYTSQICHLYFIHKKGSTLKIGNILSITLLNLTHLSIYGDDITFDEFQIFITKIDSKLKVLSITSLSEDMTYLDADRWEEFILKYLPLLQKFYLKYYVFFNNNHETLMYLNKSNRFASSFWIERRWILEAEIDFDTVMYSIGPYKEQWYEYDTQHNIMNFWKKPTKSMRIVLMSFTTEQDFDLLNENICHILTVARIYHLKISKKLFNGALIEILYLLPELNSLQISSVSLSHRRYLSIDEVELDSISKKNQITKVCLDKMFAIEEIYFLIELCPHTTHLKVDFINNMNVELFVRLILTKIVKKSNYQLRLLSFHVAAADDEIIEKLNKTIDYEKLLLDYKIIRILEHIYLQWK